LYFACVDAWTIEGVWALIDDIVVTEVQDTEWLPRKVFGRWKLVRHSFQSQTRTVHFEALISTLFKVFFSQFNWCAARRAVRHQYIDQQHTDGYGLKIKLLEVYVHLRIDNVMIETTTLKISSNVCENISHYVASNTIIHILIIQRRISTFMYAFTSKIRRKCSPLHCLQHHTLLYSIIKTTTIVIIIM